MTLLLLAVTILCVGVLAWLLSPSPIVMQRHRTPDDYAKAGLFLGALLGVVIGASVTVIVMGLR